VFAVVGLLGRNVSKIVISGDPEVMEYIETLAYYYTKYVKPGASIDVNAPGSSQAIKDVAEGIADYGMIARSLTSREAGYMGKIVTTDVTLASEAFVIIVNKEFPTDLISRMSVQTASSIFWRDEPDWREYIKDGGMEPAGLRTKRNEVFGGMKVYPVQRKKGDGLRESFEDIAGMKAQLAGNKDGKSLDNYSDKVGITKESDGEIVEYVKQTAGSAGYVRYTTYTANKDDVKMLPVENESGNLITELTAENIRGVSPEKTYPLKRRFNYFYNKDNDNPQAREFFDWVTTGYTDGEFADYMTDGEVTFANGELNAGTVPFALGLPDSIVPDYKTYRRKKVERLLTPRLEAVIAAFPYANAYDDTNEPVAIVVTGDIDLPTELDGARFEYFSSNYGAIDPEILPGKGKVTRGGKSETVALKIKAVVGRADKPALQVSREWTVLFEVKPDGGANA
jgi:ABC-type phosphate transport system substrate-binding protein